MKKNELFNFDVKNIEKGIHYNSNEQDKYYNPLSLYFSREDAGGIHIMSMEYLVPTDENVVKEFDNEVINDTKKKKDLTSKIKNTKYKYLVEDDDYIPTTWGKKLYLKDVTLRQIIDYTLQNEHFKSYFIKDDKTNKFIGFVAYFINENDNSIIDGIKMFRFDEGSIMKDMTELVNELINDFNEVHWDVHKENIKAMNTYEIFIKRKEKDGYIVDRTETSKKISYVIYKKEESLYLKKKK